MQPSYRRCVTAYTSSYVLTLEPFLRHLNANPDVRSKEYKNAACADDIPLFLSDPLISLPNIIKDLESFGSLSNLKINYSKSYALNVTVPIEQVALSKLSLPFTWQDKAITYLGTQIP